MLMLFGLKWLPIIVYFLSCLPDVISPAKWTHALGHLLDPTVILLWGGGGGDIMKKKWSVLKWSGHGNRIIIRAEWTEKEQLKAPKVKRLDIKVQHGTHPHFFVCFFTLSPPTFDKRLLVVELYIHKPKLTTKWKKKEKKTIGNCNFITVHDFGKPQTCISNIRNKRLSRF